MSATLLPAAAGSAFSALSVAATMRCISSRATVVETRGRVRTRARSGPSRSGSGFARALCSTGGRIEIGRSAPVPIDVWSATKLEKPIAGNVAVPTIRSIRGGM